ncbi:MAG: hypothetical protein P4L84_37575 [Isosphaeraceae bacterium]|nr:hypothetical protein [Isosphaeraceae bacterium]
MRSCPGQPIHRLVHQQPRLEHLEVRSLLSGVTSYSDDHRPASTGVEVGAPADSSSESDSLAEQDDLSTPVASTDDGTSQGIAQAGAGSSASHQDDSSRASTQPTPVRSTSDGDDGQPGSQPDTSDDGASTDDDAPAVVSPPTPVSSSPTGTGSTSTQTGAGSTSTSEPGANDSGSSSGNGAITPSAGSGGETAPTGSSTADGSATSPVTTLASGSRQAGAGPAASLTVSSSTASGFASGASAALPRSGSASQSADASQDTSRDEESIVSTVDRSGDVTSSTQDQGDHGLIAVGPSANGETSASGRLDPRSTQLPTLVLHDPEVHIRDDKDGPSDGDLLLGRKIATATGALHDANTGRHFDWESLRFRGADVLASCSPYEQAVIEQAIDRLLEQVSGSVTTLLPDLGPASSMIPGVVVAATLVAVESVRRWSNDDRDQAGEGRDAEDVEDSGFPGLPDRRRIWALEER